MRNPSRQVLSLLNEPSGRAIIGCRDLGNRQRQLERVHAELGLDLESVGQHGKGFHEAAREHAVAGQNILECLAEYRREKSGQHPVARAVAGPVGRDRLVDAQADHHVEVFGEQLLDHGAARWAHHRWRRHRPAHRRRHRCRRTSGAPHGPCPDASRCAPRRRPRGPPPGCGPSNCCRRRRCPPAGSALRKSATTVATAASSL